MAISPQSLEEAFQEEVNYYEKKLDMILGNKKIIKGQSISIVTPSGFNQSHFQILRCRYINAGWTDVEYKSDQRDGEWLMFKY